MKKKIISLMIVMTMTCGLFAGCGNDKASNDAGTESSSDTASGSRSDDLLSESMFLRR